MMVGATRQMMEGADVEMYEMDVAALRFAETPNGRAYALIPTRTRISVSGTAVENTSATLALEDGGAWYLMRLDAPQQIGIVIRAYPGLAGEDLEGQLAAIKAGE